MSDAEREQMEREISELLGWRCYARSDGLFVLIKPGGKVLTSAFGTVLTHPVESKMWEIYGRKWTRSEEASAELLDMMPMPSVKKTRLRGVRGKLLQMVGWECWADTIANYDHYQNPDRKVAIALAARAWLQSLTPEERTKLCV